ncbi:MAG TPA: arylesterase [Ramlibacter sp.]|uniref:arylesterase n=1 Tax=Ramlibacter sp. TaxID=1917967 RepID=UPI002B929EE3|nr:arylesterase [Ramlibacter sp.]HVZ43122.1 arylesterase [Ramlibacter sp.]
MSRRDFSAAGLAAAYRAYRAYAAYTAYTAYAACAACAVYSGRLHAGAAAPVILVVGDSLSAEYGLRRGSGWVALLAGRLAREKIPANVVNASISGDTTSGGRSRLPALLKQHSPAVVVIELGGNDALRGLPLGMTEDNLLHMIDDARKAGARVLLVGMQVPPNYGPDYARRFAAVFERVARERKTALVPFLLAGVADAPDAERLFQPDRIHPDAAAHPRMLDNVWPELRKLVKK